MPHVLRFYPSILPTVGFAELVQNLSPIGRTSLTPFHFSPIVKKFFKERIIPVNAKALST
jgi:hypothetical protein